MHYESNQTMQTSKVANEIAFVDKLVSFKGIIKIFFFFSVQLAVLSWQINRFSDSFVNIAPDNFWNFYNFLQSNVLLNYLVTIFVLLLIFAFYLGKELKTRKKEKIILFSFKFFILISVFLIVNGVFLYNMSHLYYSAISGQIGYFTPTLLFISQPLDTLAIMWVLLITSYVFVKFVSFFIHLFKRNKVVQAESTVEATEIVQKTPHINVDTYNSPQSIISAENRPSETRSLTKQEIINMQMNQINDSGQDDNKITGKSRTPAFLVNFFDDKLFKFTLLEQALIFYVITGLIFMVLLYFRTTSMMTSGNYDFQNDFLLYGTLIDYGWLEVIFYTISALVYFDVVKNHFKMPINVALKRALALLVIGIVIVYFSVLIGNQYKGTNILFFEIFKSVVLIAIPLIYFGYKNQNHSDKTVFTEFNPAFKLFYNRSMNELRDNEKSYGIVKKFIQIHKDDIKISLLQSTPVNYKEKIRVVIVNDFERLQTLLEYNGITVKSKMAIIEFTLEVFSTFLINLEVNLQDIYTDHLLKADSKDLTKSISTEFIDAKFSKLFSQWESLEQSS